MRDLALALRGRGHEPHVFSPEPGPIAEELRAAGVPFHDDLDAPLPQPDLIHGHHHPTTMSALARFPAAPGLFVCHDRLAWHDAPPEHPRLYRYVAVDEHVRERLAEEADLAPERIPVVPNGVDLARFPRRGPLPERPRRALVFSNQAREDTHLPALREACRRAELALDVVGEGVGRRVDAPERMLGRYDLVFAKARCALEALACGAAVILCDSRGLGPRVTRETVGALRRLNFGRQTLAEPLDPDAILERIRGYDPADAGRVTDRIRATAGLSRTVDALLCVYDEVLRRHAAAEPDPEAEGRALGAYVARLGSRRFALEPRSARLDLVEREVEGLRSLRSVRLARWIRARVPGVPRPR